jgi:hypothetical protein
MCIEDPCTKLRVPGCPSSPIQVISYCFLPSFVSSQPCKWKIKSYQDSIGCPELTVWQGYRA